MPAALGAPNRRFAYDIALCTLIQRDATRKLEVEMAEEMSYCCNYCDSQHTQLEFALHKLSNIHIRKMRRKLLHRGFSSVCLVCNSTLKDLKQVELHVQEHRHVERMRSYLVNSFLSTDKCTCGICGITFFDEVALEAHHLLQCHDSVAGLPNTPKLTELFKQLSGSCGTPVLSNMNHLCNVCNVTFDSIEESVTHLFTQKHVVRLRSSSCMLCKKEFTHTSDREAHIDSTKHSMAMQKCSNISKEGVLKTLYMKGGFPCMLCMIWCNSWLSLEIHLLDKKHASQYKAKQPLPLRMTFLALSERSGELFHSCDESMIRHWNQWKRGAFEERIWCHRCGVALTSINEVNQHLTTHDTDKFQMTGMLQAANLPSLVSFPEIFECSVCAISFRNTFMLNAHTASLEHYRKLVAFNSMNTVQCCSSCGLLINIDRDDNGTFVRKDLKGPLCPVKDIDASLRPLQLSHRQTNDYSAVEGVRSFGITNGTFLSPALVASTEKIIVQNEVHSCHAEANRLSEADGNHQNHSKARFVEQGVVSAGGQENISIDKEAINSGNDVNKNLIDCSLPVMNQTLHTCSSDNHVSGKSGGLGCSRNLGTCMLPEQSDGNVDGVRNSTELKVYFARKDGLHSEVRIADGGDKTPTVQTCSPLTSAGSDDNLLGQNKIVPPGQLSHDNGTKLVRDMFSVDSGIPIVVAATLAPPKNIQESLRSITAIVTETLSSALPNLYMGQSTSSLKRKNEFNVDETVDHTHLKRVCAEQALENAIQRGLRRSVCSKASELENMDPRLQNCPEEPMVRHNSRGDDKEVEMPRAVLAVAASVIQSGLPDLFGSTSEQDQGAATKAQERSPLETGDNTRKKAQEPADVKNNTLAQGAADKISVRTIPENLFEETQTQTKTSQLQPQLQPASVAIACQKHTQSVSLRPITDDRVKDKVSVLAKKASVKSASYNSKIKSNGDDEDNYNHNGEEDDYLFLDSTREQGKWWGFTDSDDSDSM